MLWLHQKLLFSEMSLYMTKKQLTLRLLLSRLWEWDCMTLAYVKKYQDAWYVAHSCLIYISIYVHKLQINDAHISIYDPGSRFATTPPPLPPWYGPKTCVLQHSAWKRGVCSVSCTVAGWPGLQTCKFAGIPATNLPKTCYLHLFAMFRLRHRGVVPLHPLLRQITL